MPPAVEIDGEVVLLIPGPEPGSETGPEAGGEPGPAEGRPAAERP